MIKQIKNISQNLNEILFSIIRIFHRDYNKIKRFQTIENY